MPDQSAGREVRWTVLLAGRVWLAAAGLLTLTGWAKTINLILLLGYVMLALWAINWFLARRSVRGLSGRRVPVGPLVANVAGSLEVEVVNESLATRSGLAIVDVGPGHRVEWTVGQLSPAVPLRLRRPLKLGRRGVYLGEPLRAVSRYPFGLIQASVDIADAVEVLVLPALGMIHSHRLMTWLTRSGRGDGRSHPQAALVPLPDADLYGLRPFRLGDSPRWVHWRTSARRGQLMVRETSRTDSRELILVVEPWRPESPDDAERTVAEQRLEGVISLAASVCWEWGRLSGMRLTLVVLGQAPQVLGGSMSAELARRMLRILAAESGCHDAQSEDDPAMTRAIRGPHPVLFVSSRPDSPTAAMLTRKLARRVCVPDAESLASFYEPPVVEVP